MDLHPSVAERHSAGLLRLFAAAAFTLVALEPGHEVAQAGCELRRQSCIAECRARYFTIDPKRDACIANCVAEATKCIREQATLGGAFTYAAPPRSVPSEKPYTERCCQVGGFGRPTADCDA